MDAIITATPNRGNRHLPDSSSPSGRRPRCRQQPLSLPPRSGIFAPPPPGEPIFENLELPGFENLPFLVGQKFGAEVEISCRGFGQKREAWGRRWQWEWWRKRAERLRSRLQEAAALPVHRDAFQALSFRWPPLRLPPAEPILLPPEDDHTEP